ncbi:apses-domain-containing protein [Coniochaeta ligniaria NRRL 30616]|uniref:Apses-domain-containing protein n=1 Tax=Coniochaeta ligniaria NRRL 30616 TaxID=1408157 RepID=A0A1J7J2W9_9PEZI|nr:apses-domain-containing protein [Coniochaeta ligniaria NRRL 30616]
MAKGGAAPGVYSATYSGIPVWEFQFGADLKEHVMRRRHDDWINATHILKAAGFDKPARTRILEREVQKDTHEKIQGGYGKYQGTWIPLEHGEALAHRNHIFERLRPIFEFQPGAESPPPAPRHASKPKAPKAKPAVPKWNSKSSAAALQRQASVSHAPQGAPIPEEYEAGDVHMHDDDTPDNLTVASASYMAEDDRFDASQFSTGHRKRKREDMIQDLTEQQHGLYGDELLDYFLLSRNSQPAIRPDPPTNFQPDWTIDTDRHTSLHWASAMGDIDVIKQLKRFGASLSSLNIRGETPFMRAVNFTNCYEKQTFPAVMKELFSTVDARDSGGFTVLHHAITMKSGRVTSQSCSRYYLDNILNRLMETYDANAVQMLMDAQDNDGNTAVHLAAMRDYRKCIRALLGRGASTDIPNNEGVRAEDLIKELNNTKSKSSRPTSGLANHPPSGLRSSSPFAPDSQQRHPHFRDAISGIDAPSATNRLAQTFASEAATTVQSRIAPLVLAKFQHLAQSYDEELAEKDSAERDARRILANTQAELAAARAALSDLEGRAESDDAAAKVAAGAASLKGQALQFVTHQSRIAIRDQVDAELAAMANGDGSAPTAEDDNPEERLRLAVELHTLLCDQRRAEADYIDARGAVGTGEQIDKYRRLLRGCLGPEYDQETLDANLDDLIKSMEEDVDTSGAGGGDVSMEIAAM